MENVIESHLKCEVFRFFYENYSCVRCALRAVKLEDIDSYQQRDQYKDLLERISTKCGVLNIAEEYGYNERYLIRENSQTKDTTIEQENKSDHEICRLCLGVLQDIDHPENVENVAKKIKEQDFEFEQFKFFIKVPLCTQIRFANILYLAEKYFASNNLLSAEEKEFFSKNYLNWRDNYIDIKTVYKWVMPELLSEIFKAPATSSVECPFVINFTIHADDDDRNQFGQFSTSIVQSTSAQEEKKRKKLKGNSSEDINFPKVDPTAQNLERISQLPRSQFLMIRNNKFPESVLSPATIEITATHGSVYIMGNYCKYSRYMSQTPWFVDGVKLFDTSIQEEIAEDMIPNFKCNNYKFSSGGREDIDVRMLGNGRPFVIEVLDPRRVLSITDKDLKIYEEQLNAKKTELKVHNLHFTDVKCFMVLKTSESEKIKSYACIVQTKDAVSAEKVAHLNSLKDIEVHQKTPIRVLHRRTQMIRTKYIYRIRAFQIGERHLVVYVLSSAGTYIKEFIHGDLERTTPNLGTFLGTEADIFQLDVVKLYPILNEESIKDFEEVCTLPRQITHWE